MSQSRNFEKLHEVTDEDCLGETSYSGSEQLDASVLLLPGEGEESSQTVKIDLV